VVPADRTRVRNLAVAEIPVKTFQCLDPKLPAPDPELDGIRVV
jgi:hypothetical protein